MYRLLFFLSLNREKKKKPFTRRIINDRSSLSPLFAQVTEHVLQLQDYVNTMSKLQVDEHEYAYLKAIALFSPGREKKRKTILISKENFICVIFFLIISNL